MKHLSYVLLLILPLRVTCQENFDLTGDEAISTQMAEQFPMNFNKASRAQLELTALFSEDQIDFILEHRQQFGGFISRFELHIIPGLTQDQFRRALQFYTVAELPLTATPKGLIHSPAEGHLMFMARYQPGLGTAYRARLEINRRNRFIGIRIDRDYSESWHWDPKRHIWGIDHLSFTIQQKFQGILKSINLGEFKLHMGEGLVHSGRFLLGKGSSPPLPVSRSTVNARPSFTENRTRQGIVIEVGDYNWRGVIYGSRVRNDAFLYEDGSFRSFSSSGYHQKENDRKKHNRLVHHSFGIIAERLWQWGSVGITVNSDGFSAPFKPVREYQKQLPQGRRHGQGAISFRWRRASWLLWSEHAVTHRLRRSSIAGVSRTIGRESALFLVLRDYSRGYLSFSGKSFGESSSALNNERGLYLGFQRTRRKKFALYTYMDLYSFPGSSYRHEEGVKGIDTRFTYTRIINSLQVRAISKTEFRNQSAGNANQSTLTSKNQIQAIFSYEHGRSIFRTQANVRKAEIMEKGWLVSLEHRWELKKASLSIQGIYFATDSYFTREFIYERDVWGTFSLPSYFGKGFKCLAFAKWRTGRITTWLRGGILYRKGKTTEEEIKVQLKYQL